jgi:hypothetical protein
MATFFDAIFLYRDNILGKEEGQISAELVGFAV